MAEREEVLGHPVGKEFGEALDAWAAAPGGGAGFPPLERGEPECRCSVVVNTVDRADELERTLADLGKEWDDRDELIVVVGPTGDESEEVVRGSPVPCVLVRCGEKNLAISRNLGWQEARGEYVAFIDDDASPAEGWLMALLAPMEKDPGVEISAGFVKDGDGTRFLNQHVVADTLGRAWWFESGEEAEAKRVEAGRERAFLTATGCNMAFRRGALDRIGGFDPFYRYFLEETDVVWRILQSGGHCEAAPASVVFHRLGSNVARKPGFDLRQRTTVVRSQIHFAGKFGKSGRAGHRPEEIAASIWDRVLGDLEKIAWDCGPVKAGNDMNCSSLQAGYLRAVAEELRLDSGRDSSSLSALSRPE